MDLNADASVAASKTVCALRSSPIFPLRDVLNTAKMASMSLLLYLASFAAALRVPSAHRAGLTHSCARRDARAQRSRPRAAASDADADAADGAALRVSVLDPDEARDPRPRRRRSPSRRP